MLTGTVGGRFPVEEAALPVAKATVRLCTEVDRYFVVKRGLGGSIWATSPQGDENRHRREKERKGNRPKIGYDRHSAGISTGIHRM